MDQQNQWLKNWTTDIPDFRNFNTTTDDEEPLAIPTGLTVASSVTYGLLFVLGVGGNLFTLFAILCAADSRAISTCVYIFNLALADLMFICWIPLVILKSLYSEWLWGTTVCKLFFYTSCLAQYSSVIFLILLCVDRYLVIVHPLKSHKWRLSRKVSFGLSIIGWIIVASLTSPVLSFASVRKEVVAVTTAGGVKTWDFKEQCGLYASEKPHHSTSDGNNLTTLYNSNSTTTSSNSTFPNLDLPPTNERRSFTLYLFAIGFLAPLIIMWTLYAAVIVKIRRRNTSRIRDTGQRKKRVTRLVLAILCTYTCCWLPLWILNLLIEFVYHQFVEKLGIWFYYIATIAFTTNYLNSALNPILYTFFSQAYRASVTNFLSSVKQHGSLSLTNNRSFSAENSKLIPPLARISVDSNFHTTSLKRPEEISMISQAGLARKQEFIKSKQAMSMG